MPKKMTIPQTDEEIALRGIAYFDNKQQIKVLEKNLREIRPVLEDYLAKNGKTMESGTIVAHVPIGLNEVVFKNTCRNGKVLLPEAIEVLRENGLGECIEDVPTIREDVLERFCQEGKVPDDVLRKVYAYKPTYAFSVEVKDRMPDAPE